jgi:hypothetical protein
MRNVFAEMLDVMDAAFRDFASALPKPRQVGDDETWAYRFKDQDIPHAVVLKLALIQSTLRAALVLHESGHLLQQAMLHRIVEEANQDVLFLSLAITNDTITPLHERYLAAFWAEEFEASDPVGTHESREMIPRKKINAYIARFTQSDGGPSRHVDLARLVTKMYSGFVHGASPHIMEIYVGSPPSFRTRGLLGTHRMEEYEADLWNYMYRGLLSHIVAAKLFGASEHVESLLAHKRRFESLAGKDYS